MPRKNAGAGKEGGKKAPEFIKLDSFEIKRTREVSTKNGSLVFADVVINGVTVYDCKAVTYTDKNDGKDKDFLAWPERKGSDDKYYKLAYAPLSPEDSQKICDAIYAKLDNDQA